MASKTDGKALSMRKLSVEKRRAGVLEMYAELDDAGRQKHTLQDIARAFGYADRSGPWQIISSSFKRETSAAVEQIREQELHKLDMAEAPLVERIVQGDEKAILTLLKIMERRARYVPGIEAPQELNVTSEQHIQALIVMLEAKAAQEGDG